jgi:hypothetical protein
MSEYKYYCEKCNYGTKLKHSFLQHNESAVHLTGMHGGIPLIVREEYKCEQCDFNTNNKNNYMTHKLNNHSTKEERTLGFKYYCETCDFGVFTESSYNKHTQTVRHKRLNNSLINKI